MYLKQKKYQGNSIMYHKSTSTKKIILIFLLQSKQYYRCPWEVKNDQIIKDVDKTIFPFFCYLSEYV